MVPLANTWFRLFLVPTVCVIVVLFVWTKQTDLNNKESGVARIISRPLNTFFVDDNGFHTQATVNVSQYSKWVNDSKQDYDSTNTSESYAQDKEDFTNEPQTNEDVQVEEPVDEGFMREREKVYSERREQVKETCKQLGDVVTYGSTGNIPLKRLRWLNSRKLIMCFNAKVGTSSWSEYLLDIAKPDIQLENLDIHIAASRILVPPYHKYSPMGQMILMKNYTKVMIVRHPFARVVSAYLNKIAGRKFRKLSKHIIRRYRPSSSSLTSTIPTFEEFVKYLVRDIPLTISIGDKFRGVGNIHWMPFYANCAPCDIPYDIILKMETIEEDTRYVSDRFHLGLKQQLRKNHHAPKSSESSAHTLFKELPRYLILDLYERYHVDFTMYGYSIDPFYVRT